MNNTNTEMDQLIEARSKIAALETHLAALHQAANEKNEKIEALTDTQAKLSVENLALQDGLQSLKDGTHPLCVENAAALAKATAEAEAAIDAVRAEHAPTLAAMRFQITEMDTKLRNPAYKMREYVAQVNQ